MNKRNPIKLVLLSLISMGFFYFKWLNETRTELMQKTTVRIPSIWYILVPLGGVVAGLLLAFIYMFVDFGPIIFLATIVGFPGFVSLIPALLFWNYKYCEAVDEMSSKQISMWNTLLIMFFLSVIGAGIIQDRYNKLDSKEKLQSTIVPASEAINEDLPASPPLSDEDKATKLNGKDL